LSYKFIITLGLLVNLSLVANVAAKTSAEKGLEVARKVEIANRGYIGETSDSEMVLIDAQGTKTVRKLRSKIKEVEGKGDKSISEFLSPKDVKGTKMLTWTHKTEDDDQWLYLPTFRRVKRISSGAKSASFLGSEFSYEDLGGQEVDKYNYKFLAEEKIAKKSMWKLERTSKKKSGYSKEIVWMIKDFMNPFKIEYYDRKGELLKVANFGKFKKYKIGKKTMYRAGFIHMKNVQTKKESKFSWSNRKIGVKLSDKIFDKRKLK
jgi:hypothetical protein